MVYAQAHPCVPMQIRNDDQKYCTKLKRLLLVSKLDKKTSRLSGARLDRVATIKLYISTQIQISYIQELNIISQLYCICENIFV